MKKEREREMKKERERDEEKEREMKKERERDREVVVIWLSRKTVDCGKVKNLICLFSTKKEEEER